MLITALWISLCGHLISMIKRQQSVVQVLDRQRPAEALYVKTWTLGWRRELMMQGWRGGGGGGRSLQWIHFLQCFPGQAPEVTSACRWGSLCDGNPVDGVQPREQSWTCPSMFSQHLLLLLQLPFNTTAPFPPSSMAACRSSASPWIGGASARHASGMDWSAAFWRCCCSWKWWCMWAQLRSISSKLDLNRVLRKVIQVKHWTKVKKSKEKSSKCRCEICWPTFKCGQPRNTT